LTPDEIGYSGRLKRTIPVARSVVLFLQTVLLAILLQVASNTKPKMVAIAKFVLVFEFLSKGVPVATVRRFSAHTSRRG